MFQSIGLMEMINLCANNYNNNNVDIDTINTWEEKLGINYIYYYYYY